MDDAEKFEWVEVCAAQQLPAESAEVVEFGSRAVAVFHHGGQYYAIDNACPHMGASLAAGHVEDCEVSCPLHAWRFDLRDGTWCDNRRVKIGSYPVRVRAGQVEVGFEREAAEEE